MKQQERAIEIALNIAVPMLTGVSDDLIGPLLAQSNMAFEKLDQLDDYSGIMKGDIAALLIGIGADIVMDRIEEARRLP
jgi:uncharacterized membrane protein